MSGNYRKKLMNMFEDQIVVDKINPVLGFHPNYVQSANGKVNKLKIFGGNQDVYGNRGGKMCNDMSDGKGYTGGEMPQTQEDYYSMRDSIRDRTKQYLIRQAGETTYGGNYNDDLYNERKKHNKISYGKGYNEKGYNGSIQTPYLTNDEMNMYKKVEMERNKEPYLTTSNILEDERRREYNKYARSTANLPITQKIVSPGVQMDIQQIKAMNDADYDTTHGRGMSGGKKVKNPNKVAAGKKSKWVKHVKKMASAMGIPYMEAVSNSKVRQSYVK